MAGEAQIASTDGTGGLRTSWAPAQPQDEGPAVLLGCARGSIAFPFSPKRKKRSSGWTRKPDATRRYRVHRPLSLLAASPHLCSGLAPAARGTLPTLARARWSPGPRSASAGARVGLVPGTALHKHRLFPLPIFPPAIETPAAELGALWDFLGSMGSPPPPRSSRQVDHPRGALMLGQIVALNEGIAPPSLASHSPVSTGSSSCGYGVLPPRPLLLLGTPNWSSNLPCPCSSSQLVFFSPSPFFPSREARALFPSRLRRSSHTLRLISAPVTPFQRIVSTQSFQFRRPPFRP